MHSPSRLASRQFFSGNRWIVWTLAVAFYFYEFVLRISPSVMLKPLAWSFQVDAAALGTMTAFYLYAYAPMQIPVGMLMDRFGARPLLTTAAAVCGVGGLVFGFAPVLLLADLGRLLMGLGSAFAYVGIVYVASTFFPPKKLPLLVGLGLSVGMLGAISGEYPVAFAVDFFGWRATAVGYGVVGLLLAIVIYWVIRRAGEPPPPLKGHPEDRPHILHNLRIVCRNPQTWINGIVGLLLYATTSVFAALWGPTFLQSAYGLSKTAAGGFTSGIFVGWLIGAPLLTFLAMKSGHRRIFLIAGAILGLITMSLVVFVADLPLVLLFVLLVLSGIASSTSALSYTLAVELNPRETKGTAAAMMNFLVMLAASGMQPLVGLILDLSSQTPAKTAILDYSRSDFEAALTLFPASFLLALIFCFFLKTPKGLVKPGEYAIPDVEG